MNNISPKRPNARAMSTDILVKIEEQDGYSNIVLNTALENNCEDDRGFISRLVYGVIERRITLDFVLDKFIHNKKAVNCAMRNVLRVGAYQLIYMDNIPKFAAINETVDIVSGYVKGDPSGAKGFVNGVLRAVDRQRENLFDDLPPGLLGVAVETSFPFHILNMWEKSYGVRFSKALGFTSELARSFNETPPTFIKVNTHLISTSQFETELEKAKISYEIHDFLPGCFKIFDTNILKQLAHFRENWYYHQDTASQIACFTLNAKKGERIADVCAAPGGKSLSVAIAMGNDGYVLAGDIHRFKCDEMKTRVDSFSLDCIEVAQKDALCEPCEGDLMSFDKVMCDVPCSGLGAIRRKPEIKYKDLDSFKELPALQYQILTQSAKLVKLGGIIQYSTCTLNLKENEKVVSRFLDGHPNFVPHMLNLPQLSASSSHEITLFPHIHGSDGFYIAQLKRVD